MHTNKLISSTSPYLLQHAHNPVDWEPWDSLALERAQKENKLLVVSIGYSACHWCHVMEHESFEDSAVAHLMNDRFVSIKIDREEHPDLDHYYMQALQLMSGQGGWPLNCIALPDGRPVWGATYLPKERWMEALTKVSDLYLQDPKKVLEYADLLQEGIESSQLIPTPATSQFLAKNLPAWLAKSIDRFDTLRGGPNRSPKFPMPGLMHFYLTAGTQLPSESLVQHAHLTLQTMALSGLNDQIGGGFFRYSTDADWKIPHFEKMLYDNALLLEAYARAYRIEANPLYQSTCKAIATYLEREIRLPNGLYLSALDADSEGEEGRFYLFTASEFDDVLGTEGPRMASYFGVGTHGLWEGGKSHPQGLQRPEEYALKTRDSGFPHALEVATNQLLHYRAKRERPGADSKGLLAWNALLVSGYAEAFRAFQTEDWRARALALGLSMQRHLFSADGEPFHQFSGGEARNLALADDYAHAIRGFLDLHEISGDHMWYDMAVDLQRRAIDGFSDDEGLFFHMTPRGKARTAVNPLETEDNVIPSSNAIMAGNLLTLGLLEGNPTWIKRAETMTLHMTGSFERYPEGYYAWMELYLRLSGDEKEWILTGPNAQNWYLKLMPLLPPGTLIRWSATRGSAPWERDRFDPQATRAFVCTRGACQLPESDLQHLLNKLQ